jgi:hypothetical protein
MCLGTRQQLTEEDEVVVWCRRDLLAEGGAEFSLAVRVEIRGDSSAGETSNRATAQRRQQTDLLG